MRVDLDDDSTTNGQPDDGFKIRREGGPKRRRRLRPALTPAQARVVVVMLGMVIAAGLGAIVWHLTAGMRAPKGQVIANVLQPGQPGTVVDTGSPVPTSGAVTRPAAPRPSQRPAQFRPPAASSRPDTRYREERPGVDTEGSEGVN